MRKVLDTLYDGAAVVAALCIIGVLAMVLMSIVSRLLHVHMPGTDDYAGYAMAGAGFLALAHTLKRNEHIRVTLVIGKFQGRARRAIELWSLSVAVLLSGLCAFYAARLSWQSHVYQDISTSTDATPLWMPQLLMAVGTAILFVAFIDEWILEVRGVRQHGEAEGTHHE